jgi:DNA polymerase I-like protein with 3'-5' exonuclease and polymerase domains
MLIQGDANALEWRAAAFLSGDKTAHAEIWGEVDQHTENQKRLGLPSRLIAKTFVFRLIYGGSAYSYANDPDFTGVSKSEKYWQKVIEEFYAKYKGIAEWHTALMQQATSTGFVKLPTGRMYHYEPSLRGRDYVWPRTTILNYPVQGLGADIMAVARVALYNRLRKLSIPDVKLINTVHDSVIIDAPDEYTEQLSNLILDVFEAVPANFEKLFGVKFTVPMKAEVEFGKDWKNMQKYVDNRSKV